MKKEPSRTPVRAAASDEKDAGHRLFAAPCAFLRATSAPEQFPPTKIPEIAFWGRSNVGKSSLINGLTGRKRLARASRTPGRTQEIIFFDLGGRLMLVDLPGYGHAKAPREERARWRELIESYLRARPPLRLLCLLIDGRHGVLSTDLEAMKMLDRAGLACQVVLTKIDEVEERDREPSIRAAEAALEKHPSIRPGAMACSAEKRIGLDELRAFLAGFADRPEKARGARPF